MFKFISNIYNYVKFIYRVNKFYNLSLTKDINDEDINRFIKILLPTIKKCGCVCIKFCQWVTPIFDIIYNTDKTDKTEGINWLKTLETFYENCPEHSLNYTFKIYSNDFNEKFNDIYELIDMVGSGSIGQVYKIKHRKSQIYYAMKTIHPDIHYEMKLFKNIINILLFIPYTKNIIYNVLPIDIYKFISLIEQQSDMIHESNNLLQMKEYYKGNSMVIIPELIRCSHNIMIMSYEDGIDIDASDKSDYEKMKIIVLLYLFSRYNFEYKNFNHADLHKGNWKITQGNKLLVYDFGYCFALENIKIIKYIAGAFIDTDNKNGAINLEMLFIEVLNVKLDSNKKFIKGYIDTYIDIGKYICCPEIILKHIFIISKHLNIIIIPQLIQAIIVQIQNQKYLTNYFINNKLEDYPNGDNIYRNDYLDYYTICKTYNIFPEMQEYFKTILNKKQVEVNGLFDMLDKTSYITEDIKQLLTFD